jgi:hypothetical protein
MARGEKPKPAHRSVARSLFCGNLGHEETQCPFKQKARAEAQKEAKFKTETHENNVINIDDFSDDLNAWMSFQKSKSSWKTWTWW